MFALITRLAVIVGTFGSLAALAIALHVPDQPFSDWEKGWIVVAVLLGTLSVAREIWDYSHGSTRVMKKTKVPTFMLKWIRSGGRIAIFSRDLSWAHDPEIKTCLLNKAGQDELILVVPKLSALPEELAAAGAEVITYPSTNYVIRSRFTIVHFESAGSRVAIGMGMDQDRHRIEIIDPSVHPAFFMAEDLIELLRRFQAERDRDAVDA